MAAKGKTRWRAAELAQKLCQDCGIQSAYINVLQMADNWLPAFDMDEQKKLDKGVDSSLARIVGDITARKRWIAPVTEADRAAHREFLANMGRLPADAWQHLIRVTDRCVGCGICERVCPSASIRVVEGKAAHIPGHCQTCLACAHACPQKAIGLSVPEKNPGARYRNEHISLAELIQANHQMNKYRRHLKTLFSLGSFGAPGPRRVEKARGPRRNVPSKRWVYHGNFC